MSTLAYIREYYGVPATVGRRVIAYGKPGVIVGGCRSGPYIQVLLDEDKPGSDRPYHPTDQIEYLGAGRMRKMTRSQQRYKRYLEVCDCFDSFGDFLRYEQRQRSEACRGF